MLVLRSQASQDKLAGKNGPGVGADGESHGMNFTHVLLNNSELGKISKEQRAGAGGNCLRPGSYLMDQNSF